MLPFACARAPLRPPAAPASLLLRRAHALAAAARPFASLPALPSASRARPALQPRPRALAAPAARAAALPPAAPMGARGAAVASHERVEDEFDEHKELFAELGIEKENKGVFNGKWGGTGPVIYSMNPTTGKILASVTTASPADVAPTVAAVRAAQKHWRSVPAPVRGQVVRHIGDALRAKKAALARLVTLEVGKILAESEGEVQEFIDMTDLALGLSRSMPGQVLPSERRSHLILEQWHPLGVTGIVTAFNFPTAVYGWNASLALVCGNGVAWKPALSTSLVSVAVTKIVHKALEDGGYPPALAALLCGGPEAGEAVCKDPGVDLVSFTGSTRVGRKVGVWVQERFGRTLLELGGNNAVVVCDDADIDLAVRGVLFSAVGTTGQRCTTTRRLLVQQGVYDRFMEALLHAYRQLKVGDPLAAGTLIGPLHNHSAVKHFKMTMDEVKEAGGSALYGGKAVEGPGLFVQPTIVQIDPEAEVVKRETFAPIMYVAKFKDLADAIRLNNSVPQGLSSAIFTSNVRALFEFIGPDGSDCGLVNVNVPTSGAEVGSSFGGEKETGGGREAGSDAWKAYCRRTSSVINFGHDLPLAQGISFSHILSSEEQAANSGTGEVDKLGYAAGGSGEGVIAGGISRQTSGGVGGGSSF